MHTEHGCVARAAWLLLPTRRPALPAVRLQVMYRLDCLYGRPGAGLRARFHGEVKRILGCSGWDEVRADLRVRGRASLLGGLPSTQAIKAVVAAARCACDRARPMQAASTGVQRGVLVLRAWAVPVPPSLPLQALDVMGLAPLSPAAWTARLRGAWLNSLAKGYHTPRTNWDR